MNEKILRLLEENARISEADIAIALGISETEVKERISKMRRSGIIRGYKCVLDRDALEAGSVSAVIEVKLTPSAGLGFDEVAQQIARYPEVESVSLMSGACDLLVTVNGKSFKEVATFVAEELSVIESVTGTATQFIMRRYKEFGVELFGNEDDGRDRVSL